MTVCCGRFPTPSETFVTSHILGLERLGHRVTVVAELIDTNLLSELQVEVPSGGIFSLGRGFRHPVAGPAEKLRLLADALPAIQAKLDGRVLLRSYLGKGLRWMGMMALRAFRLADVIPETDLVHAHFGPTALWARALARRKRIPLTVTFHGYDATSFPAELGWGAYEALLETPRTTFLAHSPFVRKELRQHLGVDALEVPLGVDTDLFAPRDGARPFRERCQGPRLAFVGNLIRQKGIRVAVETLALLQGDPSEDPLDASLEVVGQGREGNSAALLAELLEVKAGSMRIRGRLPPTGVAEVLRSSDFLLVPSSRDCSGAEEGFGLVCLEAQSCGTLVIGTDSGGLPAAVGAPVGGRCVAQQSPSAMATAVRELWSRHDLEELRMVARGRILKDHTMAATLRVYERIFREAIAGGARERSRPHSEGNSKWQTGANRSRSLCPEVGKRRGSLAAYTIGRDVLEFKRVSVPSRYHGRNLARSWTQTSPEDVGWRKSVAGNQFDILLDLEGVSAKDVILESRFYPPVLRKGGLVLLAVHVKNLEVSALSARLRGFFQRVLPLDALFDPGPIVPEETTPDMGDIVTPGRQNTMLRYLLCQV